MIPKVIHYCWFGRNPLPSLAQKCIASWRKFLPDYEIKEWNEDNFDVNIIPYTQEAYEARKYAFVSDYARFWILYHYGGLYFDTDVEVIRPMDDIVARGSFMGCECNADDKNIARVAPGLGLGAIAGLDLYKEILDLYTGLHFKTATGDLNLKTVVQYTTELLFQHGLQNKSEIQKVAGVWIYTKEYFAPIQQEGHILKITSKTVSIHHYAGSWMQGKVLWKKRIARLLGGKLTALIISLKRMIVKK